MFDDDGLFNLTDDSFEWDLLLDDDELEQDRRKRQGKKTQGDASKSKTNAVEVCSAGSLANRRARASVY